MKEKDIQRERANVDFVWFSYYFFIYFFFFCSNIQKTNVRTETTTDTTNNLNATLTNKN